MELTVFKHWLPPPAAATAGTSSAAPIVAAGANVFDRTPVAARGGVAPEVLHPRWGDPALTGAPVGGSASGGAASASTPETVGAKRARSTS